MFLELFKMAKIYIFWWRHKIFAFFPLCPPQKAKHLIQPKCYLWDLLQIGVQKRSLAFEAENSASIQAENQRLNHEINSLEKFVLSEDPKIEIKFKGLPHNGWWQSCLCSNQPEHMQM